LTRKDLKAPDEFITLTGRFLSFATQHLQTIGLILGGVIACVIGVWGLLVYVRGIEQDAFASLWPIEGQLRSAADTDAVPPASIERLQQIVHQFGAGEARGYAWLYLGHARYRQGDYAAPLSLTSKPWHRYSDRLTVVAGLLGNGVRSGGKWRFQTGSGCLPACDRHKPAG